jgi:hypothetical protein
MRRGFPKAEIIHEILFKKKNLVAILYSNLEMSKGQNKNKKIDGTIITYK